MGSFNASCGISNLSIEEGNEIGFVILKDSPEVQYGKKESGRATYVYPTDLYQPMFAPVYGKYDDYGNITDVQESLTTQVIEKVFNRSAEIVFRCITSDRAVYSSFGEIFQNYLAVPATWKSWDKVSGELLQKVGFTKDATDENTFVFDSYSLTLEKTGLYETDPKVTGWVVSDMLRGSVRAKGTMHDNFEEIMNQFSRATGIYPGFDRKDFKAVHMLRNLSGMFFLKEVYDGMKPYITAESSHKMNLKRLEEKWDEMMDFIETEEEPVLYSAKIYRAVEDVFRDVGFVDLEAIQVYGRNREPLELNILMSMMDTVNRMFGPTMGGSNDAENEASQLINKVSDAIVSRRLTESNWG